LSESNGRKEEVLKNTIEANMYIDNFWSEIMMDITKFDTLQKIKLRHFIGCNIIAKIYRLDSSFNVDICVILGIIGDLIASKIKRLYGTPGCHPCPYGGNDDYRIGIPLEFREFRKFEVSSK